MNISWLAKAPPSNHYITCVIFDSADHYLLLEVLSLGLCDTTLPGIRPTNEAISSLPPAISIYSFQPLKIDLPQASHCLLLFSLYTLSEELYIYIHGFNLHLNPNDSCLLDTLSSFGCTTRSSNSTWLRPKLSLFSTK